VLLLTQNGFGYILSVFSQTRLVTLAASYQQAVASWQLSASCCLIPAGAHSSSNKANNNNITRKDFGSKRH
jgi:hypothetical protein